MVLQVMLLYTPLHVLTMHVLSACLSFMCDCCLHKLQITVSAAKCKEMVTF